MMLFILLLLILIALSVVPVEIWALLIYMTGLALSLVLGGLFVIWVFS